MGHLDEAVTLLDETLQNQRRVLDREHPEALESMNNLAMLLEDQGKLTEARALFEETIQRERQVWATTIRVSCHRCITWPTS